MTTSFAPSLLRTLKSGDYRVPQLVLFPFLGGSSHSFHELAASLAYPGEVLAVTPPGHMGAFQLAPLDSLHAMAATYFEVLANRLTQPPIFLGYSMGGLSAFETALCFQKRAHSLCPSLLVVMACGEPRSYRKVDNRHSDLPDDEFMEHVEKFSLLPKALLENRDAMELFLPAIRSDYRALEDYTPCEGPWMGEMTVVSGAKDSLLSPSTIDGWQRYCRDNVTFIKAEGAHMFLYSEKDHAVRMIDECVTRHLLGRQRG